MDRQDRQWRELKDRYLREVRRALGRVARPQREGILNDVSQHLDRRYIELDPPERTPERFEAIIEQMGPPAEYAELLSPQAGQGPARGRLGCLCSVGLTTVVVLTAVLLGVALSEETVAYLIRFKPVPSFQARTPDELLAAFNERHPPGVRTHSFRTTVDGNTLVGTICVDTDRARDEIVKMLKQHDRLVFLDSRTATEADLQAYRASGRASPAATESVATYIVTFRAVPPFVPAGSKELLDAFNTNHPRGVRTHHFSTQGQADRLLGRISVDTDTGRDAILAMLKKSGKLELVRVETAGKAPMDTRRTTPSGRERQSSRERAPSTRNATVSRTGEWPAGTGSIQGRVFSPFQNHDVSHGKVCLSSSQFGRWIVEVDEGDFRFDNLPAGTYTVQAMDTFGYKDNYYEPDPPSDRSPGFALGERESKQADIRIEPARPYRQIRGRVLNEQGRPMTNHDLEVAAWVQRAQGSRKGTYRTLCTTRVGPDGSYTLDCLDGRPVYVQVHDVGQPVEDAPYPPRFYPGTFSRNEAKLVTFGDANSVDGVDIRMQKTGGRILEGTVVDKSTGAPISQALVTVSHADMCFDLSYGYTDERGRYRIEGLSEARFIVHVDAVHKGYVKTRRMVTIGQEPAPLDLALSRGANIRGVLIDTTGKPYPVGRGFGAAGVKGIGFRDAASNFPYGNKFAPDCIRKSSTVFYEEGQGDAGGTIMVFPDETSFLLPAVAPGEIEIDFSPRGQGHHVQAVLYDDTDIQRTGLTVAPGQDIRDIKIVVATGTGQ